jgi:hypothetical protein
VGTELTAGGFAARVIGLDVRRWPTQARKHNVDANVSIVSDLSVCVE